MAKRMCWIDCIYKQRITSRALPRPRTTKNLCFGFFGLNSSPMSDFSSRKSPQYFFQQVILEKNTAIFFKFVNEKLHQLDTVSGKFLVIFLSWDQHFFKIYLLRKNYIQKLLSVNGCREKNKEKCEKIWIIFFDFLN